MKHTPFRWTQDAIVFSLWWIAGSVIQILILKRLGLSNLESIFDSLLFQLLIAIAGFVVATTFRFYRPNNGHRGYRLLYILALSAIVIAPFHFLINAFPESPAFSDSYFTFVEKSLPIRFLFSSLSIAFIGTAYWLRTYIAEQELSQIKNNEAAILMKDAELAKLRQQLQPHFLFNSLNSISALASSRPEEARKMIQQLSDFLRGTLKKDDQQLVTLQEELHHISLYLEIEKVRFGERLHIAINTSEDCGQLKLPSLLLQPIVENAIKFGLYDNTGDVEITISTKCTPDSLFISIANPFDEHTQSVRRGTGYGLASVERRLYLIFARNDLMISKKANGLFTSTITIPQNQ